jgi:hypothetical protein
LSAIAALVGSGYRFTVRDRHPGKDSPGGHHPAASAPATPGKSTLAHEASAHAHHHGVPGGNQNVDIDHLNRHFHPGADTARIGEHDPKHHNSFRTLHATSLYDNEGVAGALVPAGSAVVINAGAITRLTCAPENKAVDCVFVFGYWLVEGGHQKYSSNGGWMKASALPHAVDHEQRTLASRIAHQRGDAHHAFEQGVPIQIKTGADAAADGIENLYTYPPPFQVNHENLAVYYYNNLSLNLPRTGGKRFGVETDRLPTHPLHASTLEFFPERPLLEASIDLFAQGAHHPSGKKLTFVYGYVKSDANAKIYGWINRSMLPAGLA